MARPRTEKPEIRRANILEAAREVMIREGSLDFVMSDVAKKAGVASGTLYLYFKDKIELFAAVFIDLLDRLDDKLLPEKNIEPGIDALRAMSETMLEFIDEYQDFLFQFTGEHPALCNTKTGDRLKDRFVSHLKNLADVIQRCMEEGSLRRTDVSFASLHFSFLIRMFMINKIIHQSTKPLRHKTPEFMDLFLRGLGND